MAKDIASTIKPADKKVVKASARQLHIAPRKMRLVTNAVKSLNVNDALVQLQHMNKKGASLVVKLLKSAVANAKNNFSLNPDNLYIKSITTDAGQIMKRYFPRARGSAFVIRRKLSHVNIVLAEKAGAASKKRKFNLFESKAKVETENPESIDQKEATNAKPAETLGKKSQVRKTEEQVKANKVTQKRRLFNRKGGE